MRMAACMVLYVRFTDNNVRTFWSRDINGKYVNNTWHWKNHFENLVTKKWKGQVKEYAIFRAAQGKRIGDAWVKEKLIE